MPFPSQPLVIPIAQESLVAVLESSWVQEAREQAAGLPTFDLNTVQIKDSLLAF